jgi:fluoride exporter
VGRVFVQIALVAVGSSLGGLLRWVVGILAGRWFGTSFPWGTFFINITGCLFLGWFSTVVQERVANGGRGWIDMGDLRLLLAVGFTGAYTTFSTYELESHNLVRDGDTLKGSIYLFGSVFVGLAAVRLGVMLARWR